MANTVDVDCPNRQVYVDSRRNDGRSGRGSTDFSRYTGCDASCGETAGTTGGEKAGDEKADDDGSFGLRNGGRSCVKVASEVRSGLGGGCSGDGYCGDCHGLDGGYCDG